MSFFPVILEAYSNVSPFRAGAIQKTSIQCPTEHTSVRAMDTGIKSRYDSVETATLLLFRGLTTESIETKVFASASGIPTLSADTPCPVTRQ